MCIKSNLPLLLLFVVGGYSKSSAQSSIDSSEKSMEESKALPSHRKPAAPKVPPVDSKKLPRFKSKEDVSSIAKENLKKAKSTPSLLENQAVSNRYIFITIDFLIILYS